MSATVRLRVDVYEITGRTRRDRRFRHLWVMTPASEGEVLVTRTHPCPHRSAVYAYHGGHDGYVGPVEVIGRRDRRPPHLSPVWTFVATLELPRA